MLIAAVVFLVILGVILARIISLINDEKIRALSIFLGVNEIQINKFKGYPCIEKIYILCMKRARILYIIKHLVPHDVPGVP